MYAMDIKVQMNGVGSSYTLANSPYAINCIVSTTDATKTIISGNGITNAVAGVTNSF
jgi:hypothetical protein